MKPIRKPAPALLALVRDREASALDLEVEELLSTSPAPAPAEAWTKVGAGGPPPAGVPVLVQYDVAGSIVVGLALFTSSTDAFGQSFMSGVRVVGAEVELTSIVAWQTVQGAEGLVLPEPVVVPVVEAELVDEDEEAEIEAERWQRERERQWREQEFALSMRGQLQYHAPQRSPQPVRETMLPPGPTFLTSGGPGKWGG